MVDKKKKTVAWSTDSEIEYVNRLAAFEPDEEDKFNLIGQPRDTLLKGYVASIRNRVRWANVDRKLVAKHARALLLEVEGLHGNY